MKVEQRLPGAGERRVRNGELLFNEYRISICDDEKVLKMDSGDGCTIVWMHLMPLNAYLNG